MNNIYVRYINCAYEYRFSFVKEILSTDLLLMRTSSFSKVSVINLLLINILFVKTNFVVLEFYLVNILLK